MPYFHYEVLNAEGNSQQGEMEGPSAEALADSLQKRGLVVLSIAAANKPKEAKAKSKSKSKPKRTRGPNEVITTDNATTLWERLNAVSVHGSVNLNVILLFTSQLSSMIGAGLHLLKSLNSLSEDSSDKRFQAIINEVRKDVEGGEAFSAALAKYPKVFGTIYVNLVKAAEATGDLDVILNQLAEYLEKTLNLRRKVKGAMTYPVCILAFAGVAILILIAKIVPSFQQTFAKLGADLPAPTQFLIMVSDIIRNYFFSVIFVAGAIGGTLYYILFKTVKGRFFWDSVIIKMPVFGPLIWKSTLTRFLSTLSILLDSGVTVLEAFSLAGQASGNLMLEKAAMDCIEDIKDGKTINGAMGDCGIFPNMVLRMISSGEEAGTLPEMLRKVAVYFEQQVDTAVDSLSALIEPLLIVFLGTVVGFIVVAIFLPIFKLGEAVKGVGKKGGH